MTSLHNGGHPPLHASVVCPILTRTYRTLPTITMPPKKLEQRSSKSPPQQDEDAPSQDDLKSLIASTKDSPESALQDAASKAEAALAAQKTASSLRSAADTIRDPAKREKYLQDAYKKEVEAHGNSKKARVLSSGAFRGQSGWRDWYGCWSGAGDGRGDCDRDCCDDSYDGGGGLWARGWVGFMGLGLI
ncbi:hypothetical protein N0V83_008087 [Neocucurbitaria cava]|uniref:Uncharacterized protein n=1 Tax=Neocucurbitaria cava TaxID=798079 RepID=A0A9W9CK42_9PLEO|nr:hypothetical protein N0V83_008087 [Neocucurbitaria cava]